MADPRLVSLAREAASGVEASAALILTRLEDGYAERDRGRVLAETLEALLEDDRAGLAQTPEVVMPAVQQPPDGPRCFLALPSYDGRVHTVALPGLMFATQRDIVWTCQTSQGSLLSLTFNRLWTMALNTRAAKGWTHFAMCHSDVEAPPGWLDVLTDEMAAHGADVMAACPMIKDPRGLLSTGTRSRDGHIRRLTATEFHRLPETFDADAVKAAGMAVSADADLVVNTGLWVCRLGPWADEFPGFTIVDVIVTDEQGVKHPRALSEDWCWSEWAARQGLKVMATRKVPVKHHGQAVYANDSAWGAATDPGD